MTPPSRNRGGAFAIARNIARAFAIANLIFRVIRTSDVTACGASELCDA